MNDRIYYSKDAERRVQREKLVTAATCIAIGLGVGAAVIALIAPKDIEEQRRELGNNIEKSLHEGQKNVEKVARNVEHEAKDFANKVGDRIDGIAHR